jgi:peptidoglycan/xylan/chitin deacetylase (PgdA/CDA1 family)
MLTLLYHNVLTDPAALPVADSQVTLETFSKQVSRHRRHLLHPLEVHEQLIQGKTPDGFLITFDDGAAGIVDAARVLAELGTAGVAFVCPGALESGLWFYRLADGLSRATVSRLSWREYDLPLATPRDRFVAYRVLSAELFDAPAATRDEKLAAILNTLQLPAGNPDPALATLDKPGLRRAAETGGLFFANHSWSHPNLVKLDAAELEHEIGAAQDWLRDSRLPSLPWFAFPRGAHDARVRRAVADVCPLAFGANAKESDPGVRPRTYLCEADSNRLRFAAKTAWSGRLRRHLLWR